MPRRLHISFIILILFNLNACQSQELKSGTQTQIDPYSVAESSNAISQSPSLLIQAPLSGILHGANPDFGGTEDIVTAERITDFENMVGKEIAWAYFSNNWIDGIRFPNEAVQTIAELGKIPFIRMMPRSQWSDWGRDPVYRLNRFLNGRFDNDLRQWARDAKATGIPLMVEFGTEVNGAWFPWNGKWNGAGRTTRYGDPTLADGPERFRDTYRHIIDLFREEGVTNITWVFHVDAYSYPHNKWNTMAAYYPGDDYIDWIGVSAYGPQEPGEDWWQSFEEIMQDSYDELASISSTKPLALLEFGVVDYPDMGHKADWIEGVFDTLSSGDYPRFKAISYWNETFTNDDGGVSNLRIDSSPESLAAYQTGIASDLFVTSLTDIIEDPITIEEQPIPDASTDSVWSVALNAEAWHVLYSGYGSVSFDETGVTLEPLASSVQYETHAALALEKITETCPVQDFNLRFSATTHSQLRENFTPNAWEVFWIFFNYKPTVDLQKETNYFILKPNGIELGTASESIGQEFLFTANNPTLQLGTSDTYEIDKVGQNLTVTINGSVVLTYDGANGPHPLYDHPGSIGIYTEDAAATLHDMQITPYDDQVSECQ